MVVSRTRAPQPIPELQPVLQKKLTYGHIAGHRSPVALPSTANVAGTLLVFERELGSVPHDPPFHKVDHVLGNVGRVVCNALKMP